MTNEEMIVIIGSHRNGASYERIGILFKRSVSEIHEVIKRYFNISEPSDLLNKRFGRLTVLEFAGRKGRVNMWRCICTCGKIKITGVYQLKLGHTKSCGCLITDHNKKMSTHGMTNTKEFKAWMGLKNRCSDKTNYHYGARGIKVCDRWVNNFELFLEDMGKAPTPAHSLDRIDVNGDYEPSNCRWATIQQQNQNKTTSRYITHLGKSMILSLWAKEFGINNKNLRILLKNNTMEEIEEKIKHKKVKTLSDENQRYNTLKQFSEQNSFVTV